MAAEAARRLGTTAEKVLVASTGIIGHRLPMKKIVAGIADATSRLGKGNDAAALRAIMTTDMREKYAVSRGIVGGKKITVAGMVKGAGMIAPSMATLIAVLTTDAAITPAALHKALKAANEESLNTVTVDSDTSTSDTVAIFASGDAGNKMIAAGSADFAKFRMLLSQVLGQLARAVAYDGEGATKLITIAVRSAHNDADALLAAKSVANSPLFKCAVHGGDPNWGRIACALGKSAAKVDPEKLVIKIGGVTIFSRGKGLRFNLKKVARHLRDKNVFVQADLNLGKARYTALTCDLSREYVTINADYHT
jgi:glutamate N-acetyltransferase/amino-acid N-acetyltransferase